MSVYLENETKSSVWSGAARYNAADREAMRRVVDNLPLLQDLERLGLLDEDWGKRINAIRQQLNTPMRLYAIADRDRGTGNVQLEAQCAELSDAGYGVLNQGEFIDLLADRDTLGHPAEDDWLEVTLVQARDDSNRPRVIVRWTRQGDHPAVDGKIQEMELLDWRTLERADET